MAKRDFTHQPLEPTGSLVPFNQPIDRVLLPYEKTLCDFIGCSHAEYKEFLEELERSTYVRPAEYAHIPDVRNEPALTSALISIAIGLVLSAVSYLLTPKPRALEQDQTRQLVRRGRNGQDRFLQSTSFDGYADLAEFGEAIPVIWTRYTGTTGGVVVAPLLIWSRAYSLGNQQAAKLVYLVGEAGPSAPDIAGIFIGNTALSVQQASTYSFIWNGKPNSDTTTITKTPPESVFSACLTPSNSTQFGVANPVPNATEYRVNWKAIYYPEDLEDATENDVRNERRKVCGNPSRDSGMPGVGRGYPRRQGVISAGKDQRGTEFLISSNGLEKESNDFDKPTTINTDDINNSLNSECIATDDIMQIGEQFVVGEQLVTITNRSQDMWTTKNSVVVSLSAAIPGATRGDIERNQALTDNEKPSSKSYNTIYYPLCRAVIASFRNNRRCEVTEIGIKSQVWGRVSGLCDFSDVPTPSTLERYDNENVQLTLGNNTEYITRFSMFQVYIREAGATTWSKVGPVLAVRGATPTDQHNQIRVAHGTEKEYEFQIMPVSSSAIRDGLDTLYVLNSKLDYTSIGALQVKAEPHTIYLDRATERLDPFFETPQTLSRGWGSETGTATYNIPTAAVYSTIKMFAPSQSSTTSDTTAAVDITAELPANKLRDAYFTELFGEPTRENQIKTAALKSKTADGTLKFLLKAIAFYPNPNATLPELHWKFSSVEVTSAKPATPRSFVLNDTFSNTQKVKVSNKYLADLPDRLRVNKVNLVMTFAISAIQATSLSSEDRGWRIFEKYTAFSEVSHYGNMITHSCDSSPEHEIVYVNQIGGASLGTYADTSTACLALKSNRNISSVEQLRLWIKSGVNNSNSFPRLVQYLLQNVKGVASSMIDTASFDAADAYCNANGLFYDGAITSRTNLRTFISSTAPFFLLNFVMRNGKLALIPALTSSGPSAMFTAGNIIEGSFSLEYLDITERRPIRAEMIWRENFLNQFPRQRSFVLGSPGDALETFDMSAYCTSEAHARKAGNYIIALRQYVTHAISFKTTLDNAFIGPGSVISVALDHTSTSRFTNGSINSAGIITSAQNMPDGNYEIVYFKSGNPATQTATLIVANGRTTNTALYGAIFSVTQQSTYTRTYLVEQVELDEEGLVSVSATEYPYNAIANAVGA